MREAAGRLVGTALLLTLVAPGECQAQQRRLQRPQDPVRRSSAQLEPVAPSPSTAALVRAARDGLRRQTPEYRRRYQAGVKRLRSGIADPRSAQPVGIRRSPAYSALQADLASLRKKWDSLSSSREAAQRFESDRQRLLGAHRELLEEVGAEIVVDPENLRRDLDELVRDHYGSGVKAQVGRNGEIFFASERDPYAGIGSGVSGAAPPPAPETSLSFTPPFSQSFEVDITNVEHRAFTAIYEDPPSLRVGAGGSFGAFPTAEETTAEAHFGEVVYVPPGYSSIQVTARFTMTNNTLDLLGSNLPYLLSGAHFLQIGLQAPTGSPLASGSMMNWKTAAGGMIPGALPPASVPSLRASPTELVVSETWDLNGKSGEHLVSAGAVGTYSTWGLTAGIFAFLDARVESIEVEILK